MLVVDDPKRHDPSAPPRADAGMQVMSLELKRQPEGDGTECNGIELIDLVVQSRVEGIGQLRRQSASDRAVAGIGDLGGRRPRHAHGRDDACERAEHRDSGGQAASMIVGQRACLPRAPRRPEGCGDPHGDER